MPDNEENINENENQNENQSESQSESQNESSSNDGNDQVAPSNDGSSNQVAPSNDDSSNQVAPSNDYIYDEETHQWRLRTENDPEPSDVELIILEGTDVTDGINRASDRITAAVNENLDVRSGEILSAFGAAQKNSLKEEIIAEIIERLKPEGHVYPDTSLYPEWITPCKRGFFTKTSSDYHTIYSYNCSQHSDYNVGISNTPTADNKYELEHMDTSKFQNLSYMFDGWYFSDSSNIAELDLRGWDVSHVKSLYRFLGDSDFIKKLNLSGWDVRNVTNMESVFSFPSNSGSGGIQYYSRAKLIELKLDNWDVRNVSHMDFMFYRLYSLPELDLSTWDLSYVNCFFKAFTGCFSMNKLLWGGAINAPVLSNNSNSSLDLGETVITPENANLFFNSLSPKTASHEVVIKMPSTSQGADVSIATNKGYTIAGITAP